ncbi:hypothetical protein K438DRAFT_1577403, partial [Mycena galopus ATCC 62051]
IIQRKQQTCSRWKSLKYPKESGSPENHKKAYCSDGFKPTLPGGEALPQWPLPAGIFTKGTEFHPFLFLAYVREVYEHLSVANIKLEDLPLEDDVFLKLLSSRLVVDANGSVLFKLFNVFTIPSAHNVPDNLTVTHNGSLYLYVNSLRNTELPT